MTVSGLDQPAAQAIERRPDRQVLGRIVDVHRPRVVQDLAAGLDDPQVWGIPTEQQHIARPVWVVDLEAVQDGDLRVTLARLGPGVSITSAAVQLNSIQDQLWREMPSGSDR